jgi:protein-S-isoprenylcysteine O-methyltransferase Ste14
MSDTPGVIAPPPLIFLGALVIGLGLEQIWPIEGIAHRGAGYALFLAGIVLLILAIQAFRRASTNVQTRKPSTTIVEAGPYKYSRNPIYVGMALMLVGIGLAVGSAWTILMVVPFLGIIRTGVIAREERYLAAKFGGAYDSYRSRVRRWI